MSGGRRGFWLRAITLLILLAGCPAAASATPMLTISWDPVPEATRYRVDRAIAADGLFVLFKTVTTSSTRVEMPINVPRCYRIRAVDDLDQSSLPSAKLCATVVVEVTE